MKAETITISRFSMRAEALRETLGEIAGTVNDLPEAAREGCLPRLVRLEVMQGALERDISELLLPFGATEDTVVALLANLETEVKDFGHEVDALAQGNPTTVSAVLDASLHAVEWISGAIKKRVSRVPAEPKA